MRKNYDVKYLEVYYCWFYIDLNMLEFDVSLLLLKYFYVVYL